MATRVQSPVEAFEPEALEPAAEDGLHDDQPAARHPQALIEHGFGFVTVVEGEQDERAVEGAVAEGQPGAVVDDVGSRGPAERPDVARAHPATPKGGEGRRHIALTGPEVEDAAPHREWGHRGGLAPCVPAEEGLQHLAGPTGSP